jgi:oligopeptide transport system permease protein
MYNVYTYKSSMPAYIFRRILVAVIAFFVISFFIFKIFNDAQWSFGGYFPMPGIEYENMSDSIFLNYFRWLGAIFTGDWGESLLGESYYLK